MLYILGSGTEAHTTSPMIWEDHVSAYGRGACVCAYLVGKGIEVATCSEIWNAIVQWRVTRLMRI
jgi:hypothetical protein